MTFCLNFLGIRNKRQYYKTTTAAAATGERNYGNSSTDAGADVNNANDGDYNNNNIDQSQHPGKQQLQRIFGSDLEQQVAAAQRPVPWIVEWCIKFIEQCCLADLAECHQATNYNIISNNSSPTAAASTSISTSIYRIPGAKRDVDALRLAFDKQQQSPLHHHHYTATTTTEPGDSRLFHYNKTTVSSTPFPTMAPIDAGKVNAVASLLKQYFSQLPNPLIPEVLQSKFIEAVLSDASSSGCCNNKNNIDNVAKVANNSNSYNTKRNGLFAITAYELLPPVSKNVFEYLILHLAWITRQPGAMTAESLATVWAPNIFHSKTPNQVLQHIAILEMLITMTSRLLLATTTANSTDQTTEASAILQSNDQQQQRIMSGGGDSPTIMLQTLNSATVAELPDQIMSSTSSPTAATSAVPITNQPNLVALQTSSPLALFTSHNNNNYNIHTSHHQQQSLLQLAQQSSSDQANCSSSNNNYNISLTKAAEFDVVIASAPPKASTETAATKPRLPRQSSSRAKSMRLPAPSAPSAISCNGNSSSSSSSSGNIMSQYDSHLYNHYYRYSSRRRPTKSTQQQHNNDNSNTLLQMQSSIAASRAGNALQPLGSTMLHHSNTFTTTHPRPLPHHHSASSPTARPTRYLRVVVK